MREVRRANWFILGLCLVLVCTVSCAWLRNMENSGRTDKFLSYAETFLSGAEAGAAVGLFGPYGPVATVTCEGLKASIEALRKISDAFFTTSVVSVAQVADATVDVVKAMQAVNQVGAQAGITQ